MEFILVDIIVGWLDPAAVVASPSLDSNLNPSTDATSHWLNGAREAAATCLISIRALALICNRLITREHFAFFRSHAAVVEAVT